MGMTDDWFDADGNIKDDLNIHDKSIPCIYRLGFAMRLEGPCTSCVYHTMCYTDDMREKKRIMGKLKINYPQLFDGSVQTRKQYLENILHIY